MDRSNINNIAQTPEDRLLLAKVWDKITVGIRKNIVASTRFLSPRELEMTRYLFGDVPGLTAFGGHEESERKMLVFLPEYLDESILYDEESPIRCIRATYFENDALTHRDFLGALTGFGIAREMIGDIYTATGSCDFFVAEEVSGYILQSFLSAGRTKLRVESIPVSKVHIPEPEISEIRDTVASVRLDSVIASGFRIGRSLAAQYVTEGRTAINGLPCTKPDKAVSEGVKISVRGLGKILLHTIGHQTKKGRISITIHRYL